MISYEWKSVHPMQKAFWKCLDVFLREEDIKDFVAPDNMSRFPPDVSPLLWMLSTKRDKSFLFKKYSSLLTKNIKVFFSRYILNFLPKKKYSQLLAKKECSFSALILIHTKWNSIHIPLLQNRGNNSLKEEWLLVLNCRFSSYWQNIINLTFTPSLFQNILTPNIYIEDRHKLWWSKMQFISINYYQS